MLRTFAHLNRMFLINVIPFASTVWKSPEKFFGPTEFLPDRILAGENFGGRLADRILAPKLRPDFDGDTCPHHRMSGTREDGGQKAVQEAMRAGQEAVLEAMRGLQEAVQDMQQDEQIPVSMFNRLRYRLVQSVTNCDTLMVTNKQLRIQIEEMRAARKGLTTLLENAEFCKLDDDKLEALHNKLLATLKKVTSLRMARDIIERENPKMCCPLSLKLMLDPVCTVDGISYERQQIETYFANIVKAGKDLETPHRVLVDTTRVVPNQYLRIEIENLVAKKAAEMMEQKTAKRKADELAPDEPDELQPEELRSAIALCSAKRART